MKIAGFLKTSLLDWDGHVVANIYLSGCNFRCPFCHNGELVLDQQDLSEVPLADIIEYLRENSEFLDGVVITGGEPTLHPDLPDLIRELRKTGLKIKLDTNGSNPEMLKDLIESNLVDYIAMDIKAPLNSKYEDLIGCAAPLEKIKESISLTMRSGIDYEFRTTVVPILLTADDIELIAAFIGGSRKYALQQFRPGRCLDPNLNIIRPYGKGSMLGMAENAKLYVRKTVIRGDV